MFLAFSPPAMGEPFPWRWPVRESSIFWMNIIHHIAKELAKQGANMLYTYMPTGYREGYALPAPLTQAGVDGFLVLNVYDRRLLEMLAATSLPKVFLDTVPTLHPGDLHGDLVILRATNRITSTSLRGCYPPGAHAWDLSGT